MLLWLETRPLNGTEAQQEKKDSLLPGQVGSVGNKTILNGLSSSEENELWGKRCSGDLTSYNKILSVNY